MCRSDTISKRERGRGRGAAHTSGVKALRAPTHDGVNVFEMNLISVELGGRELEG